MDDALATLNTLTQELADKVHAYCREHTSIGPRALLERLMPKILGEAPQWAKEQHQPSGWAISLGDVANIGVFCVYYGTDENGERIALVQQRKEVLADGRYGLGAVGGYANPGEPDHIAIGRETIEEVCDDNGEPIFTPRYQAYRGLYNGVNENTNPAIHYHAMAYELNAKEIAALKQHIAKLEDPDYCAAVKKATHDEVNKLEFRPLEKIVSRLARPFFTYPEQQDAFIATHRMLLSEKILPSNFERDPALAGYLGRAA